MKNSRNNFQQTFKEFSSLLNEIIKLASDWPQSGWVAIADDGNGSVLLFAAERWQG